MKNNINQLISTSLVINLIIFSGFMFFEPKIINALEDQITISQSVTSELSVSSPSNVTMSPSIAGITGGTSNGSATWTVITNDSAGFSMSLKASSSPAMQGISQGGTIPNYTPAAAGVPDYAWSVGVNTGEFGYTVEPATTADTGASFLDNGSACNTGSGNTADSCYLDATTTNMTIINRTSETAGAGEAEVVKFKLQITASPSPAIPEDTYTATTTVTVVTN